MPLSVDDKAIEARRIIQMLLGELDQILNRARQDKDFDAAFQRLRRWVERASEAVGEAINRKESERLAKLRKGSFMMGQPLVNLHDEIQMYKGFLQALSEELESYPGGLLRPAVPSSDSTISVEAAPSPGASNPIFLIHGHDELNLRRLKEMLKERWNLDSVVLSSKPGKGRTLIEKFEQEAQPASHARRIRRDGGRTG